MTAVEAEIRQAHQLVGGVIEAVLETPPIEPGFGLRVRKGGTTFHVWVDCDPEGNGPGHLEIEIQ